MKALLLAGGYGTRLHPITQSLPKCLVPINGEPLLKIWIEKLVKVGVTKILINTHYLDEIVRKFVESSPHKQIIELVYEKELLGTAGTLIQNLDFFQNSDGFVIHADNYCEDDLTEFMNAHLKRPAGCDMTMMAFEVEDGSKFGTLVTDDENKVIEFYEKDKNSRYKIANAAIYLMSKSMFFKLKNYKGAFDISLNIIPHFLGKIYMYKSKKRIVDIGTIESYKSVNNK